MKAYRNFEHGTLLILIFTGENTLCSNKEMMDSGLQL